MAEVGPTLAVHVGRGAVGVVVLPGGLPGKRSYPQNAIRPQRKSNPQLGRSGPMSAHASFRAMARTEERDRVRDRLDRLRTAPRDSDAENSDAEKRDATSDGPDSADGREAELGDGPAVPDWLRFEPDPPRSWLPERLRSARVTVSGRATAALGVVALLAALVAGFSVLRDRPVTQEVPPLPLVETNTLAVSTAAPTVPAPRQEELVVSVVGLVLHSGLVKLPPGSRVADAIAAAGGAREGADLLSLNMAQRVSDGDQILVGVAGADGGAPVLGSATVGAGTASSGAAARTGKVNLNTATEAELDALPGVGPVTAAAIVAWRDVNGRFTDVEQLGEVDGIGPSRLGKLRELVTV